MSEPDSLNSTSAGMHAHRTHDTRDFSEFLQHDLLQQRVKSAELVEIRGKVNHVIGTIIHATLRDAKIGELCRLINPDDQSEIIAEVVGIAKGVCLLTPIGDMEGLSSKTQVVATGEKHRIPVGEGLLGRVVDGLGKPLDGLGELKCSDFYPLMCDTPNPMTRQPIDRPLVTGIRAIDSTLTIGSGQRLGIFAAAGGGKSTLLSMITRGSDADVIVIGLIGERGREVREFIERDLGPEGLARAVVVVSTSDRSSLERVKAAYSATTIAEYFRDQGKRVLLLMDSVTRFARALREIGLAAGEPPTRRGFPPSVFANLPKLLERTGANEKGSITALYTVLVEGNDMTEPVADETRSILDGHIVLSRELGEAGHYPAIDVLASVSRVMTNIVPAKQIRLAQHLRALLAKHKEVELLVKIGEYQAGTDELADEAVAKIKPINQFLCQDLHDISPLQTTCDALQKIVQA